MSLSQDAPVEKTGMKRDRIKFPAGYRDIDDPKSFYVECGRPCWQSKLRWNCPPTLRPYGLARSLSEEWGGNLLRLLATLPARARRHTKRPAVPKETGLFVVSTIARRNPASGRWASAWARRDTS